MLKKKNLSKICLILLLFIIGSANVKALPIQYTKFSLAEELCDGDFIVTKIGGKTLDEVQKKLDEINQNYPCGGGTSSALGQDGSCFANRFSAYQNLYKSCPVDCRQCIGIDVTLSTTDPLLKQRCSQDLCKSWVTNYCNATGQASSVKDCKARCECETTEELRESCKKQCEVEWTEEGNGDLDFSNKDGCDALGGLMGMITALYKNIRILLGVGLIIITMFDYAKVVIDNSDFKNFKKANNNFKVRIAILIVLYVLPELINFIMTQIGYGQYFCW